jgi:hypothetical protein
LQIFELGAGGDYLFNAASDSWYRKDDADIAQIIEFFHREGKDLTPYYSSSSHTYGLGELWHINELRYWPFDYVLHDEYLFPKKKQVV